MNFKLSTAVWQYPDADSRKKLQEIGFAFIMNDSYGILMDNDCKPNIEINSLEELIQFSEKFGKLIVSNGSIQIYDDYIE